MGAWDVLGLSSSSSGASGVGMGNECISVGLLTSCFWLCQNVAQRAFGVIGMHAGRGGFMFSTGVGLLATTCNLGLAQYADRMLKPHVVNMVSRYNVNIPEVLRVHPLPQRGYFFGNSNSKLSSYILGSTKRKKVEGIKRVLLGLSLYALLERRAFHTAFPSSVIELGVFANSWTARHRSVPSNSEIATSAQRMAIQALGNKYGCHQCGSKQVFTKETFIADHMPPTKFVKETNAKWWRRTFRMPMKQRLWPQCRKCFQQQGLAVRRASHVPIYHIAWGLHHLAPAWAYVLCQNEDVSRSLNTLVEPVVDAIEYVEAHLHRSFK